MSTPLTTADRQSLVARILRVCKTPKHVRELALLAGIDIKVNPDDPIWTVAFDLVRLSESGAVGVDGAHFSWGNLHRVLDFVR